MLWFDGKNLHDHTSRPGALPKATLICIFQATQFHSLYFFFNQKIIYALEIWVFCLRKMPNQNLKCTDLDKIMLKKLKLIIHKQNNYSNKILRVCSKLKLIPKNWPLNWPKSGWVYQSARKISFPSLNTHSCNRRPLCSTFTFENVRNPKKPVLLKKTNYNNNNLSCNFLVRTL